MARTQHVSLINRVLCEDVGRFFFTRPAGFEYRAGQWIRLTLPVEEGPDTKTFSLASSPLAEDLELITRDSGSPFKAALWALRPGDSVTIVGPGGRLSIPEGVSDPVFLVGGVGIAPIIGLLRDSRRRGHHLEGSLLMYGNRDPVCVEYATELEDMAEIGLEVVPVFEREAGPAESGFITAETVRRHVDRLHDRVFVITGPPVMVESMERVLDELAVPSGHRVVERFNASVG